MIHYHGTPISGDKIVQSRFLKGRHALVSFYNPQSIAVVADVCQSFVLDNGAFSHWSSGKGEIDFHAYVDWVLEWSRHPGFDWCLIPDKIDGTEEENCDLVNKWLRLAPNAKGVPIWHLHESLEYLDFLVSGFQVVAIGSSGEYSKPNTKKWWQRMSEAMSVICDEQGRPRCKLHGLRMLDPDVFTRLPLSSADSTNAGVNAGSISRFGMYTPPTAEQRADVIAERIEAHNSSPIWAKFTQDSLF